jgi:hypothetical protein
MKLGALTITRGDERKMFKPQLHRNISKQKLRIDHHIIVDYPPKGKKNDMFERMKLGVEKAVALGIDWLYIFEDDDYYSEHHTEVLRHREGKNMVGISETVYYHIKNKAYRKQTHNGRASLFATAFNPLYVIDFFQSRVNSKYIDVDLWKWAKHTHLLPDVRSCTGIKHGVGLCGGYGHNGLSYSKDDFNLSMFKSRVDEKGFNFYKGLDL